MAEADDAMRARLIAALPGVHPWGTVADTLLPTVRALIAEELRAWAGDADMGHPFLGPGVRCERLRDRADALDPR